MESSEYLYQEACTIYDRTGAIAWRSDELSEIWDLKMVECSHRFLYFEDCIRLFDFRKIKIEKTPSEDGVSFCKIEKK